MEIRISSKLLGTSVLILLLFVAVFVDGGAEAQENQDAITAISWSSHGTSLAVGYLNGHIEIISVGGQVQLSLVMHTARVTELAWHPSGGWLASGSADGSVRVWDVSTGTLVRSHTGLTLITGVSWSNDGRELWAISLQDQPNLFVWNAESGELIASATVGSLYDPQWNETGTSLVAGSGGTVPVIVDTDSNIGSSYLDESAFPLALGEQIFSVAWSPDGTHVAGGTPNGHVRVWNVDTAQLIMDAGGDEHYDISKWRSSLIVELAFTAGGEQIQAIDGSGVFQAWDVTTSDLLGQEQLPMATPPVYAAAFSPDGTQIAYGGESGALRIEPVPSSACSFTITAGDAAGIISAINAANANLVPDTICLAADSTYTLTAAHNTQAGVNGLPAITTDITIVGNGATITRDSAAAPFRLLFVDTMGNLTLEDVTLSNGLASLGEPGDDGGAIYSLGSLTLVDSTLTANTANADGGGILSDGTLTIEGTSRIEGNAAADDGGGIYAAGGTLTVTDATIAANSAGDQGGGIRSVTSTVTLTNASLTGNTASSASGGGLYATSTALTIHGGTISGNVANTGGGLYLTNSPSSAQIDGGVQIVNNSATSGGGLYLSEDGQAALTNVRVAGNQASSSSAGIRMGGILTITDSEISNNGSAMQPGSGGGIRASGTLTIINSTLTGNQVSSSSGLGAGIYVADGGTVSVSGGEVSDNHAYRGGGFYVTGSLSLSTTVSENSATGHGGGLYVSTGTATADYCTFTGNTALVTGGGIYNNALLQAANTIFSGNSAQDRAGAVYAGSVVDSWVHSSCISGNTSPNTGGVYSGPTGFDATNNWWGAADGPSGAGSGSGDAVNNRVVVTPFLTTGCPAGAGAQTEQGIMTLRAPVPMSVTSKALEPQQLPIETAFEDETGWRATGTWLLDTLSGHNAAPSWAVNTVPRDQTSILELLAPVELGRARSPRLTFWQRGQIAASDMVMVEVLPEDETDWVVIDRQTSLPTDWTPREVDLSAYRGQTVQLRVRVVAGGELSVGDRTLGLWLDDLSITSR